MFASPKAPAASAPHKPQRPTVNFTASAVDPHESDLSLDGLLVERPAATFFFRAQGDAMQASGILPGAILVVDRSLRPAPGRIVVACVEGDLIVRRLCSIDGRLHLASDAMNARPFPVSGEMGLVIWGVVTYAINDLR